MHGFKRIWYELYTNIANLSSYPFVYRFSGEVSIFHSFPSASAYGYQNC
jgi:hypothetical protein